MTATVKRRLLSLARAAGLYQPLDADLTAIAALTRTRGDLIRGGASAWEDFAASAANTFVGGDGTDVTTRTAAQVRTSLNLVTGSYTPTLTNVANLSASTAFTTYYMRVNDMVVVAGKFQADAVAAASTSTQMGMSLPIASALTVDAQLGGSALQASGRQPIEVTGDTTNDRANFFWVSQSTANENISFIFQYVIL